MTWNLIGHEWAAQLLQGHITNDSLRHAYLITGPRDIGKQTLAVRFIQAIHCPSPVEPGIPCLTCSTCSRLERLEYPDLFPIRVEEGSKQIKIDQVRELVRDLSLTPYEASKKVGLLIDFELANRNAQNSILKTLEEPPGAAMIILTAVSASSLFETVSSRCEEIKLNTVPIQTIQQGLEKLYGIPSDEAEFLAHISGGKPELARRFHQRPDLLERRADLLDKHFELLGGNSVTRFLYADQVWKDTEMIQELLNIWSSVWIDILHYKAESGSPTRNIDRVEQLEIISAKIDLPAARSVLAAFQRAHELLVIHSNTRLTLEDLLLQLPSIKG
jgi:DNA polymerase-3 subunit delta'